ncbi:MAG: hypothetical protein ABSG15_08535 [FCB group bacterium]|jgi:hypothetical protein
MEIKKIIEITVQTNVHLQKLHKKAGCGEVRRCFEGGGNKINLLNK